MIRTDIIEKFSDSGFLVTQEAVVMIQESELPLAVVDEVLRNVDESVLVVAPPNVTAAKESMNSRKKNVKPMLLFDHNEEDISDVIVESPLSETHIAGTRLRQRQPLPITILEDITESSNCVGTYEEFVQYFRNRYDRLSVIINRRLATRPIESLTLFNRRREALFDDEVSTVGKISIVGMVNEMRDTPNGHRVIELEDPTGYFSGIALKDKSAYNAALQVVHDEVIGITGSLASDGKVIFIDSITWPEIPPQNQPTYSATDVYVALTSDIHVGSNTFLIDAWNDFADWISSSDDERARKTAYVIVAGDVVDGIGVFPNQEEELAIDDIDDQYAEAASLIDMLPSELSIIISPGNHDAVRQAEPQPALSSDYAKSFSNNVTCVGNPSLIELCGVKILIYHGRALDDIIAAIPGSSYSNPDGAMKEMLKRRHLSPVYGNRVSIAPESTDHFIIETIPDILHSGHVHTIGASQYRGVNVVNSGTWQGQTKYQKSLNINPRPGVMPVCNLASMETTFIDFLKNNGHESS
ncbi:MAG: DNA-directed DNA polymerase II small subunit [Halobacteriota archaeon]